MIQGSLFGQKSFALVDGNSFYASCEITTRPELRGQPVGVLSNNDGCFVSATKELKKLGIKTGTVYFEVKKMCEKNRVHVFSANFNNYTYLSKLMFKAMRKHSPFLKVYSVDEGLIDITLIPARERLEYGFKVMKDIFNDSGIPTGVGIGPNMSLCKIANKWAKSDPRYKNVFEINEYNLDYVLENTSIDKLWGIGRAKQTTLKKLGVHNAKQLRDFPFIEKIQKLLTINGRKLQLELQGVYCFRLDEPFEKKKEISHNRTLMTRTNDMKILKESLATYATLAADELRRDGSICKEVRLYLNTDPFKPELPQYYGNIGMKLPAFTFDTCKIIESVWEILESVYDPKFEYRKIGVGLCSFQDYDQHQSSLFGLDDSEKRVSLMKVIDTVNNQYGEETLRSGACGIKNGNYETTRKMKSPSYFTEWAEVQKIIKILT